MVLHRHTVHPILRQSAPFNTLTLHLTIGCCRAKFLTSGIETGIRETVIGVVGDGDDAHGTGDVATQPDHILAGEFIGADDGVQNPIGPEDEVAVDGEGERMLWCHL